VPLGPSDFVTSSHRPVHYFFGGVPLPSPPLLPHQGLSKRAASSATSPRRRSSHPSPPSLPPAASTTSLSLTLPPLLCQARAPFRAGIGNPESPLPNPRSLARHEGTEQADRRCRASLRPAPSPSARSTATSVPTSYNRRGQSASSPCPILRNEFKANMPERSESSSNRNPFRLSLGKPLNHLVRWCSTARPGK